MNQIQQAVRTELPPNPNLGPKLPQTETKSYTKSITLSIPKLPPAATEGSKDALLLSFTKGICYPFADLFEEGINISQFFKRVLGAQTQREVKAPDLLRTIVKVSSITVLGVGLFLTPTSLALSLNFLSIGVMLGMGLGKAVFLKPSSQIQNEEEKSKNQEQLGKIFTIFSLGALITKYGFRSNAMISVLSAAAMITNYFPAKVSEKREQVNPRSSEDVV